MAESDDKFQKFLDDAAKDMWSRLLFMYANDRMNEEEFMSDTLPCSVGLLVLNPSNCECVRKILLDPPEARRRMSFCTNRLGGRMRENEEYYADFNSKDGIYSFKLWWIILLRFYIQQTKDDTVLELKVQKEVHTIVECLLGNFDRHPQLPKINCHDMLKPKTFMSGEYPIEGQATLYFSLKSAHELMNLPQFEDGQRLMGWNLNSTRERINNQMAIMEFLIPKHYWVDNSNCQTALLQEGFYQDDIDMIETTGSLKGNCIAILSSLATPQEAEAIMNFVEKSWTLVIENPHQLDNYLLHQLNNHYIYKKWHEDFPGLFWLLVAASIKAGKVEIAKRVVEVFEEHYLPLPSGIGLKDGKSKENWTYCGYCISKVLIEKNSAISNFSFEKASTSKTEYLSPFLEQREKIITRFKLIKTHFEELRRQIEEAYVEWLIYCRNTHLQKICQQVRTNYGIDPRAAREFLLGLLSRMDRNWTTGLELNWIIGLELTYAFLEQISENSNGPLGRLLHKNFNDHHALMNNNLVMVHDLALQTGLVNLRERLLKREDLYIPRPRSERFWTVVEECERTGKCLDCNINQAIITLPCGDKYSCEECFYKLSNECCSEASQWLRVPYFCVLCDKTIDFPYFPV